VRRERLFIHQRPRKDLQERGEEAEGGKKEYFLDSRGKGGLLLFEKKKEGGDCP